VSEWRQVRIGDFLHRAKSPVSLRDDEEYQLVTVRMHHNGVTLREKKKGKLIGSNMYRVKTGQFILSGIDARNGAFGVIPEELDGAIVTNDFWYFDIDDTVVSCDFFLWLTSTPLFLDACIKSSEGTTNRRRLQSERFFNFSFNFPGVSEQHRLAERFAAFDATYSALKNESDLQASYFKELRQSVLQEAVEGKLTADWRRQHPLVKGDPQHDAAALLAQIKAEKERLVKAGKIRKEKPLPPIADADKPYELPAGWVWCRLGTVTKIFAEYSFDSHDFRTDIGAKCIKITNAGVQELIETEDRLPASFIDDYPDFLVQEGDLVIALTRPYISTGLKVSKCPATYHNSLLNQRVAAIRKTTSVSHEYIYDFMITDLVLNSYKEKFEKANLQPNLRMGDLTDLLVPLPPLVEQQAIVARVDSLMATIDALEAQVTERKEQARQLMQAVLREAFAGG